MKASISRILFALCILLSIVTSAVGQKSEEYTPKYEMRGVWLTTIHGLDWPSKPARNLRDEERQQRELTTMLDRLQSLGINTVFLQVRGRGEVIYPSDVEPMSPAIANDYIPQYDPLKFAIRECHMRGMAVHAWLVVMPLGPPKFWRSLGSKAYPRQNYGNTITYKGHTYMNPADPQTGKHMRQIVRELLTKYELEGIHLDYIRYPDRAKDFPDMNWYRRSKTTLSLEEWRRANIGNVVKDIYEEIRLHSSSVQLSAAVIGAYSQIPGCRIGWTARDDVYQDPVLWDKGNYIDFIVPMHYTKGANFIPVINDWKRRISKPIVVGLGAYRVLPNEGNWSSSEVSQQTLTVQKDSLLGGVCYFRAKQIDTPTSSVHRLLKQQCFDGPVLPYAWHATNNDTLVTPPKAPEWLEMEISGDNITLKWKNRNTQPVLFAVYARANGDKPGTTTGRDLITVTEKPEAVVPLSIMTNADEDYLQIEVSTFDLKTGLESFATGGAAYYRKPMEVIQEVKEVKDAKHPKGKKHRR